MAKRKFGALPHDQEFLNLATVLKGVKAADVKAIVEAGVSWALLWTWFVKYTPTVFIPVALAVIAMISTGGVTWEAVVALLLKYKDATLGMVEELLTALGVAFPPVPPVTLPGAAGS